METEKFKKKYVEAYVEHDKGLFSSSVDIYAPSLNHGIMGIGKTVDEAKKDLYISLAEMIVSYVEKDQEVPDELLGVEFEFKYVE